MTIARPGIRSRSRPLGCAMLIAGFSTAIAILMTAAALAVAAMTAFSPLADAQTKNAQNRADCKSIDGTWSQGTKSPDGHTYSSCCYRDYYGTVRCDIYQDDNWLAEAPDKQGPPPVSKPASPPADNAPVTNLPPAAH